jgi:hypothetical protein
MKKLIALLIVAVSVHGGVYAEAGWCSVTDAAVVAQDKELQEQAQKSVHQIVDALNDFVSLAMRKIAVRTNAHDKKQLQKIIMQLDQLLSMYKHAFEEGDADLMDAATQQQFAEEFQEWMMRCMSLIDAFTENKSGLSLDDTFARAIRVALFEEVQKIVAQLKNNLK